MKLDHINLTVPNMQETIDYYTSTLGFVLKEQYTGNGMTFTFLSDGHLVYEILEDPSLKDTIIDHIAYVSENIQEDYDKYKKLGLVTTPLSCIDFLFEHGVYYFFIKGAGNEKIEFCQRKEIK